MSQQKSAYLLIAVSFVMGMIATTSISGCDSGKSTEATKNVPSSSMDGEGSSQIQMEKPAENAESPAADTPAADNPATGAPAAAEPPAPAGN
jgi:hypothetical protein